MPGKRVSPRVLIFGVGMFIVTHVTKHLFHLQPKNVMIVTFSEHLAALMKIHDWSAAELARRSGLSHVAIANYLKGRTPRYSEAQKLADALGLNPDYLLNPDRYTQPFEVAAKAIEGIEDSDLRAREFNRIAKLETLRLQDRQEGWEAAGDVVREESPLDTEWRCRALRAEAKLKAIQEVLGSDLNR